VGAASFESWLETTQGMEGMINPDGFILDSVVSALTNELLPYFTPSVSKERARGIAQALLGEPEFPYSAIVEMLTPNGVHLGFDTIIQRNLVAMKCWQVWLQSIE